MSDPIKMTTAICENAGLQANVDALIRNLPNRHAIMSGHYSNKATVFRLALSEKAQAANQETWSELSRIGPHMRQGSNRIAQGLENLDDGVLLISEAAIGNPYLPYLKDRDPQHSARLASWLFQYTRPSLESREAMIDFWLKQARKSSKKQPFPRLKSKEDQILERMQNLAIRIKGQPWRIAISHGDFHPNNLLWDGVNLTGIDIGGSSYLPIYKDMARCLVHLARRDILLSDEHIFGVDQSLIRTFSKQFALSEFEQDTLLPYFIGFECLIKVEQPNAPSWRLRAAETLYDRFLIDAL